MTATYATTGRHYDRWFYEYQREGALRSALALLPTLLQVLPVRSVLDVGCGAGAWLGAFDRLGITDTVGVDGDYVDRSLLLFDPVRFVPSNVGVKFDLGRRFDLVQCLEVAEHVPAEKSEVLIDNITRHGKVVLFSAAVPGQGGENHVNERPYEYWRDHFARRGYRLFDFVRPLVKAIDEIEPWYRYNTLLFVHDDEIDALAPALKASRVPNNAPVRDVSPPQYRIRKGFLRWLPVPVVTSLAVWNSHRVVNARRPK